MDDWMRTHLADERRRRRNGAAMFFEAIRDSNVDLLQVAVEYLNNHTVDGWKGAMRLAARCEAVSPEIQDAFLTVWIETGSFPLRVGHRPTLAAALRKLLPRTPGVGPMTLYRGTGTLERRRRLYGFSWTTDREMARNFAAGNPDPGIILETVAPADAILIVREAEDFYDEAEVVVDPYRLGKIRVAETVPGIILTLPS
jgi:hypothetical protein